MELEYRASVLRKEGFLGGLWSGRAVCLFWKAASKAALTVAGLGGPAKCCNWMGGFQVRFFVSELEYRTSVVS